MSISLSVSEHEENQLVVGHYKIGPESFKVFFYEKLQKRVNFYDVKLREQKVDGPKYLNIDFIQDQVDSLNLMVNIDQSSDSGNAVKSFDDFQTPKMTKFDELISKVQAATGKTKQKRRARVFKIKLMTLNNYFYDSEVLLIFDGYNVYKYIEEKRSQYNQKLF